MDFGGENMEKTVCGAKNRKGTPCQRKPLKNGRCSSHGGKSTGPRDKEKHSQSLLGNKNALKTGEFESISYDALTEEEKELYEIVSTDPVKQVNGRLKIIEIRTLRIMKRYTEELQKVKPNNSLLESFEFALSRIDARAVELIRENRELLEREGDTEEYAPLTQLNDILKGIREDRRKDSKLGIKP